MIVNTYTRRPQIQYGVHSTATVTARYGNSTGVTLVDLLKCCEANYALLLELINFMKRSGFRRERPSRQDLMDKLNQVYTETIDNRRELKRLRAISEETDGHIRKLQEHQKKNG